jgi:hypothetical protein
MRDKQIDDCGSTAAKSKKVLGISIFDFSKDTNAKNKKNLKNVA